MKNREEIDKRLKNKKIRPTAIREMVLHSFLKYDNALSLKDIQTELDPADKSTIFRTLKTFEKNLLIHRIDDGSSSQKYALYPRSNESTIQKQHIHFVCSQCHHTYCLSTMKVPKILLPENFTQNTTNIIIHGICSHCNCLSRK